MEGGIHRKAQRQSGRIQPESTREYRRNKRLIGTVSSSDGGDRGKKMLPNPHGSSAETCVFVFNAVCNLGFSIKHFLAQLFLTWPLPQGLKGVFVSKHSSPSFSPKPCCRQRDSSALSGGTSLLGGGCPFQLCTVSTQSSPCCRLCPTALHHCVLGQDCTYRLSTVQVRWGQHGLYFSTAPINLCCSWWQVVLVLGHRYGHCPPPNGLTVTQLKWGMLFEPVLRGRPGVLSTDSPRLLHHEQWPPSSAGN